eukprot:SAG31_NODE_5856_length_2291_cov_10.778285_2_plen_142_part_00
MRTVFYLNPVVQTIAAVMGPEAIVHHEDLRLRPGATIVCTTQTDRAQAEREDWRSNPHRTGGVSFSLQQVGEWASHGLPVLLITPAEQPARLFLASGGSSCAQATPRGTGAGTGGRCPPLQKFDASAAVQSPRLITAWSDA